MFTFVDAQTNTTDLGEYTFTFTVSAGGPERKFKFAFGCRAAVTNIATDFVRLQDSSGPDVSVIDEITQADTGASCMAYGGHFSASQLTNPYATSIAVVVNLNNTALRTAAALWEAPGSSKVDRSGPYDHAEDSDPVNGGAAMDLDFLLDVPDQGDAIGWGFVGDVGGADAFSITGLGSDEQGQTGAENARYVAARSTALSAETNRAIEFAQSGAGTNLFSGVGVVSSWAVHTYSGFAQQYFERIADVGTDFKDAIAAFIDGMVSDGLWSLHDAIYLSQGLVSSTDALQNMKDPGHTGALVGAPTFDQATGFTYDGVDDAFDCNYNPGDGSGTHQWTQNSGCMWAYCATSGLTAGPLCGTPVSDTRLFPNVGGSAFFRMNTGDGSVSGANTNTVGLFAANRSNSNTVTGYVRGSQLATDGAKTSNTLANEDINIARASATFIAANIPIAGFSSSMNGTQQGNLNTRVTTLLAALVAGGDPIITNREMAGGIGAMSGGMSMRTTKSSILLPEKRLIVPGWRLQGNSRLSGMGARV